ncbi:31589_t:CDS:2 [Gigaspora margarita]|uniref:31589_t:CDS:1 n=1 Tax=Gigaspora margarita TaxID=4874 RepID=A0ABM8VXJ6_GIGMA|nr:31589_t:CDS:2 [Gigaspora margarita]
MIIELFKDNKIEKEKKIDKNFSGLHRKVFCPFLGVNWHKTIKTCRGIKVCERTNMNIAKTPHYNVNPDTNLFLHNDNNLNEENQIKIIQLKYLATIKANCSYKNYTCKRNLFIQYYNILRDENQNENTFNEESNI